MTIIALMASLQGNAQSLLSNPFGAVSGKANASVNAPLNKAQALASVTSTARAKVNPVMLEKLLTNENARVIVEFRDEVPASIKASGSKADKIKEMKRTYAATHVRLKAALQQENLTWHETFSNFPIAVAQTKGRAALVRLLNNPDVVKVRVDEVSTYALANSLSLVHASPVGAAGYTAAGAAIAVIDTGADYTSPAFGSCAAPGGSCRISLAEAPPGYSYVAPRTSHGTNVAAIAAGVAPGAKILSFDVFNGTSGASDTNILWALNRVLDLSAANNISAVNLSLGKSVKWTSQCGTSSYTTPFANLRAVGVSAVVAAGNNGWTDGVAEPACVPGAIVVGNYYSANYGGLSWGGGVSLHGQHHRC